MAKKLDYGFIKNSFEDKQCILKSTKYINAHTKLDYICPNGHEQSVTWNNFKQSGGCRCQVCGTIERSNALRYNINKIRAAFESEFYILKSKTYINAHTHLEYTCPNGHEDKITWSNWNHKNKHRCPLCSDRISRQEKEIQLFLNGNNIDFVPNTKEILINPLTNSHLELDLYFPNLNKAIEFNGEYWHSKPKAIKRDKIKANLCKEKGIDLMIIMYKDWIKDEDKCKQQIINFLTLVGEKNGNN